MVDAKIYIRVQRNGKWLNLDLTECTDAELITFFAEKNQDELIRWMVVLIHWITNLEKID